MRGSSREPARTIPATLALSRVGLADDRLGRRGVSELSTRQVTLIQADHPGVVAHLARVDEVNPLGLRRNLVVSGINLLAHEDCQAPGGECSTGKRRTLSRLFAPGRGHWTRRPRAAMRGHGGMTPCVLVSGPINVDDIVKAQE